MSASPGTSAISRATLPSASRIRRSRMTRLCTFEPSVPASGPSLMRKLMVSVGGSMGWAAMGSVTAGSQMVSATVALVRPAMEMMSPAMPSSIDWRSRPRKARIFDTLPCSTTVPSHDIALTVWFGLTVPERTRPVSTRPRKGLASMVVASMRNGPSSMAGSGTCSSTRSNSGAMVCFAPSGFSDIQPSLAEP